MISSLPFRGARCAPATMDEPGNDSMNFAIFRRAAPLAVALLAACQPARAVQPAPVASAQERREATLDALLRAQFGDRPVDPAYRGTLLRMLTLAQSTAAATPGTAQPATASPQLERALREVQASGGDTEAMQRILQRYIAETQAGEPRQP